MPIVARTKAIPELLSRTRDRFVAAWPHDEPHDKLHGQDARC
jgi:hypothetical protein